MDNKVIIIIPALNATSTLQKQLSQLQYKINHSDILVFDTSLNDPTIKIAQTEVLSLLLNFRTHKTACKCDNIRISRFLS